MANDRTILITGVTGQQGGAVLQALQGAGFHLRGLKRNPDSAGGGTGAPGRRDRPGRSQ